MAELHVVPDARGATSRYPTANEAERAARLQAEGGRIDRIVLHDSYGRTRELLVGRRPSRR